MVFGRNRSLSDVLSMLGNAVHTSVHVHYGGNNEQGLYELARQQLQQDPLSGHLFAFINRRATQIKVLGNRLSRKRKQGSVRPHSTS